MTARFLADGYRNGITGENPRYFPHSDSRLFLIGSWPNPCNADQKMRVEEAVEIAR